MYIHGLIWPDERTEHIARHGIEPNEVEEVCFGHALVLRTKSRGPSPVYHVLGQTDAGRPLFCVVIRLQDGLAYPVTARPMSDRELRRYRQWKG